MELNTGKVVIPIKRDGEHVGDLRINPNDVIFAEKYYGLLADFERRYPEFTEQVAALEDDKAVDMFGIPRNTPAALALTKEFCQWVRGLIDSVFGENTSDMVFGDAVVPELFETFFSALAPHINGARMDAVQKYAAPKSKGVLQ